MWAALAGAAGNMLGGYFANKSAKNESQRNRDFQKHMSNTSYQRSMSDMKKAGLNPMLAYKQGGASTPSGATAQQQNIAEGASASAKDVSATKVNSKQLELLDSQIQNTKVNSAKMAAETNYTNKKSGIAEKDEYSKGMQKKYMQKAEKGATSLINKATDWLTNSARKNSIAHPKSNTPKKKVHGKWKGPML